MTYNDWKITTTGDISKFSLTTLKCLDLTHPSSEINKSPTPGIEREPGWLHAYDP